MNINQWIQSLVLVKLGQELGSDSRLARAIHDAIEILLAVTK
jgi:hypothetical protein